MKEQCADAMQTICGFTYTRPQSAAAALRLRRRNHRCAEARAALTVDTVHLELDARGAMCKHCRGGRVGVLEDAAVAGERGRERRMQPVAQLGVLVVDGAVDDDAERAASVRRADLDQHRDEAGGEDARGAADHGVDDLLHLHPTDTASAPPQATRAAVRSGGMEQHGCSSTRRRSDRPVRKRANHGACADFQKRVRILAPGRQHYNARARTHPAVALCMRSMHMQPGSRHACAHTGLRRARMQADGVADARMEDRHGRRCIAVQCTARIGVYQLSQWWIQQAQVRGVATKERGGYRPAGEQGAVDAAHAERMHEDRGGAALRDRVVIVNGSNLRRAEGVLQRQAAPGGLCQHTRPLDYLQEGPAPRGARQQRLRPPGCPCAPPRRTHTSTCGNKCNLNCELATPWHVVAVLGVLRGEPMMWWWCRYGSSAVPIPAGAERPPPPAARPAIQRGVQTLWDSVPDVVADWRSAGGCSSSCHGMTAAAPSHRRDDYRDRVCLAGCWLCTEKPAIVAITAVTVERAAGGGVNEGVQAMGGQGPHLRTISGMYMPDTSFSKGCVPGRTDASSRARSARHRGTNSLSNAPHSVLTTVSASAGAPGCFMAGMLAIFSM